MPTFTTNRIIIAFPIEDFELTQRLGELFDPDSGGRDTFTLDRTDKNCVWTSTVVYEYLEPLLRSRNPEEWFPLLSELASMKGVEPLTQEEVTHLCEVCLIDDEFNNLPTPDLIPEEARPIE